MTTGVGAMGTTRPTVPPLERPSILREGRVAGLSREELLRFGTPLYVYDLDLVERQLHALRAALPPRFDIAYAVKANPALAVVAFLGGLGTGADVASAGELETVRRAGIEAQRVIFTGPGKRDEEIEAAVSAGVRALTVESPGELDRVEAAAARLGRRPNVLLRLAVGPGPGGGVYRVAGREREDGGGAGERGELHGKFGMDPGDLEATAERAARSPQVRLVGIHAFGFSNVVHASVIARHVASTVGFAARLFGSLGLPLEVVDVGGGLGIPYSETDPILDLADLGARLADLHRSWTAEPHLRDLHVVLEPGRFLVGPAGAYVARVLDVKEVGGRRIAVTDGGIHHAIRPALTGHVHRLAIVGHEDDGQDRPVWPHATLVAGPLCTSLDLLGELRGPAPRPGDLLALLDAGAYGFTESMPLFLSHPTAAEVAVRRGRAELIRPRIDPHAWLEGQRVPAW